MEKEIIKKAVKRIIKRKATQKRCPKHPKYFGKGKPTPNCQECLKLYLQTQQTPRAPIKPEKTFKDKTKYDRKTIKKDWD